jgi:hypothetical protein
MGGRLRIPFRPVTGLGGTLRGIEPPEHAMQRVGVPSDPRMGAAYRAAMPNGPVRPFK